MLIIGFEGRGKTISRLLKNWKFLVAIAISITGILVPFGISRIDQRKALSIHILSQTSLNPSSQEVMPGLQIMIDGIPLQKPFLSVLQLINNGNIPITTKDFESPLEVRVDPSSSIIRARVSAKAPDDIHAEIEENKEAVRIKPTLLNPNDSITIAILSSGDQPRFFPKARIVGVHTVPLRDAMKDDPKPFKKWLLLLGMSIGAVLTMTMLVRLLDFFSNNQTGVTLRPRSAIGIVLFLGAVSEFWALDFFEIVGLNSLFQMMLAVTTVFILAIPFARKLEYHRNVKSNSQE